MKAIYFACIFILLSIQSLSKKIVYTQVTFLYDIKRGEIQKSRGSRSFEYYMSHFEKQLMTDCNMIIYGQKELGEFVWKRRQAHNTVFIERSITQFKDYWYEPLIFKLWNTSSLGKDIQDKSTFRYYRYNYDLLMMAKIQVMYESLKYDKFNTDILIWTDGGHSHTYSQTINIFYPQNTFKKFYQLVQPQWVFYCYPWHVNVTDAFSSGWEIRYGVGRKLDWSEMVIATTHGGYVEVVKDMKSAFQNLLKITLQHGDLGSDESIDSMMPVKFPYLIPSTTTLYTKNLINKINVNENVNRKPSHSRGFGCRFSLENIQINFDYPICKDNILGKFDRKVLNVSRIPILSLMGTQKIEQEFAKPILIIDSHQTISDKLNSFKQSFYLHLVIVFLLALSYGFMQSLKRSFKQSDYTFLKSQKLSDRSEIFI